MTQELDSDLARIANLSQKETNILQSLPYYDPSGSGISLSELARKTRIPHSTLPRYLSMLKARGFVISRKIGSRPRYFENVSGALQMVPSVQKYRTVHTLHGYKNIISIFERLAALSPKQRLSGIQPDKSVQNVFKKLPLNYLLKFNKTIKSKGLIVEGIVHEKSVETVQKHFGKNARKVFDSFVGRLEDYTKIPDGFSDVGAEIYIFKNSVNLINWETETAVVITDQSMVQLLKAMFDCVKAVGTRYSQSEKMKKYLQPVLADQTLGSVEHKQN